MSGDVAGLAEGCAAATSGERGGRSVVSSAPDSAVFTYDVELEPHAIPKLARPILRWWLQHSLRRDLRRLRSFVVHAQSA